ncbi:MAG: aminotransferase class V-fold PLP-dependent enzyme [Vicinamibacterales bacterium]
MTPPATPPVSAPGATRHAPLAMDADTFSTLGHQLIDRIAGRLAAIPAGPVTRDESPSAVRAALGLGGPLPEQGTDAAGLLAETTERLFDHSLFNAHPRFFGYITASPAPIGMLGDLLAAALNPNVGAWTLSPAATEIEAETVRWIASLLGYSEQCGGLLVSGGNMANIVGFLAARAAKAGWDVRAEGLRGAGRGRALRVYVSAETHTWVQKAADISGLGTAAIRWIPTDRDLRMDMGALERQVREDAAAGDVPLLVVGTAGSVSTGVVDPLAALADFCEAHGLWFHVDGAYGGVAAAVADAPDDLRALARADSVAVDPHKWLYAPLEAGCALVRDADALRAAFSYHPPYYHFDERATNFVDYGPQNSRGFRALKVWLALKQVGASGYRAMIAEDMRLSRLLAEVVDAHDELELATRQLSITTFRYVPRELGAQAARGDAAVEARIDGLNRALLDRLQRGGEAFVSNAVIDGRYLLRACIVNFQTSEADIRALPGIVVRTGRALYAEGAGS